MKDVTFGVKVPEDLRDEINEIMKASGLVGREFMQELVDSYRLDKGKQEIPEMAEEIKELQLLTHRVNEMYLYLGTRFQNTLALKEKEKEDGQLEVDKVKQDYEETIEKYKKERQEAKEKFLKLEEELAGAKKVKIQSGRTIDELKGYNENYKELSKQYKDTIDKLTKKVHDLNHLKESNDKLVDDNKGLQENNDRLASDLWFSKRELEKLSETITKDKEEYKRHSGQIKDQYQLEIQTIRLELQLEKQKEIESLKSKAADMQKEYNDKLKELLFDMKIKDPKEG